MNTTNTTRTIIRISATAAVLTLVLSLRAGATDVDETPFKVFTFRGAATEQAMRDKDYARVIDQYRVVGAWFGMHDLVNLCAAHVFEGNYRAARRTCSKAATYRSSVSLRNSRRDVWAAHANYAVASALAGDYDAARRAIARADQTGGERSLLDHNIVAIEQLSAPGTEISLNE